MEDSLEEKTHEKIYEKIRTVNCAQQKHNDVTRRRGAGNNGVCDSSHRVFFALQVF